MMLFLAQQHVDIKFVNAIRDDNFRIKNYQLKYFQ